MTVLDILRTEVSRPEYDGLGAEEVEAKLWELTETMAPTSPVTWPQLINAIGLANTATLKAVLDAAAIKNEVVAFGVTMLAPNMGGVKLAETELRAAVEAAHDNRELSDELFAQLAPYLGVPVPRLHEIGITDIGLGDILAVLPEKRQALEKKRLTPEQITDEELAAILAKPDVADDVDVVEAIDVGPVRR